MITLSAKITLADGTEIALDKRNLMNMDSEMNDRADIVLPSWGLISNGGRVNFVDYDGSIKGLAQSLKLTSKTKINIFLTNTLTGATMPVGEYFAQNWQYDNNNGNVSVSVTDGLQKMQDIAITPLEYDLSQEDYSMTATELYNYLCNQVIANGFDMVQTYEADFDNATLNHLNKIIVKLPYITATNLWRALNDFAVAFQLHIYTDRKGAIVCVYNGGD